MVNYSRFFQGWMCVQVVKQAFRTVCLSLLFTCFIQAADSHEFSERGSRYRLVPGDSVHVSYRLTPEYDCTVEVQPDGFVTLPLLGDVVLAGHTIPEIEQVLRAKASERLNDPEITVDLKSFEQPYYIVGGEVGAPGRFAIRGRITALRAVQIAGGFKTSAKDSQVLLIRPVSGVDGRARILNLKRVVDRQELVEDVELQAGDLLIVPRNRLSKIEPYVKLANAGFYLNPLGF